MKLITKVLCLSLVLGALLCMTPSASAEIVILDTEKETTFYLEYTDACAVEGKLIFTNPVIISNVQYDMTDSNMEGAVENGNIFLYSSDPEGVSGKIAVTVTVHSGAEKGASCDVIFQYAITESGATVPGSTQFAVNTVTVGTFGADPTDPVVPSTPTAGAWVDTTQLKAQILIAENLTYYDYTKESWAEVSTALKNARDKLTSKSQTEVDQATNQLKTALANLSGMDYSQLIAALEGVYDMKKQEKLEPAWNRFLAALDKARTLRTSGDQAAVDEAVQELLESKAELDRILAIVSKPETVEKPVKVPTEPDYTYCNNAWHTVGLIAMIASLVMNLALIGVILFYTVKKQMNKKDKTPLVEYDIDDDYFE